MENLHGNKATKWARRARSLPACLCHSPRPLTAKLWAPPAGRLVPCGRPARLALGSPDGNGRSLARRRGKPVYCLLRLGGAADVRAERGDCSSAETRPSLQAPPACRRVYRPRAAAAAPMATSWPRAVPSKTSASGERAAQNWRSKVQLAAESAAEFMNPCARCH